MAPRLTVSQYVKKAWSSTPNADERTLRNILTQGGRISSPKRNPTSKRSSVFGGLAAIEQSG